MGIVSDACEASKVGRSTVYKYRRECPEFAGLWEEAESLGTALLEDIAIKRAKASSDVLLIFLLKARKPNVYKDVSRTEQTGPNGGPIQIEQRIASAAELRSLPPDELLRIHRETLGLPETSGE